jgi:hypothetical protein
MYTMTLNLNKLFYCIRLQIKSNIDKNDACACASLYHLYHTVDVKSNIDKHAECICTIFPPYWTVVINGNIGNHHDSAYAQVHLCLTLYRLTLIFTCIRTIWNWVRVIFCSFTQCQQSTLGTMAEVNATDVLPYCALIFSL